MVVKIRASQQIKRIAFNREVRVLCPFCQSRRLVRRGKAKVKKAVNGIKQRYFCFNCNKFTLKPIEK